MMYQKILIATDGSELAGRAVAHGLKLAKELNVPVVVVTVTRMWSALEIAHEARLTKANPIESYQESVASASSSFTYQKVPPPRGSSQRLSSRVAISS